MFFLPFLHVVEVDRRGELGSRFAGILLGGLLLVAYWQEWIRSPFGLDLGILLTFIFGYRTFSHAIQDVIARRVTADQAVAVAALAALYVGEYLAAAEVVYIMLVGATLEEWAAQRFRTDLDQLLKALPHHVTVVRDGREQRIHLPEVVAGDTVFVYPGERIPVDGVTLEGESLVDESSITGESVSREKASGSRLYAGTLNQTGRLLVRAEEVGETTVLHRIVDLVHHAREKKGHIQRTADRYAGWFLPLVMVVAVTAYLVTGDWMRSVAILVVACPCAMVLATPAAVLAAVSTLARRGIIVKGGSFLERLAQVNCFAFDKTGTLTEGRPELVRVVVFADFEPAEVLRWAASVEAFSEHLLARAICEGARKAELEPIPALRVERHTGLGIDGRFNDSHPARLERRVLVGSVRFVREQGVQLESQHLAAAEEAAGEGAVPVLVIVDGRPAGLLALQDRLRPEAGKVIHQLHHLGIHKTVLLTGDSLKTAQRVARSVGITEVEAGLLPEEKLSRLDGLKRQGLVVAMVGDGINDSPSLAMADVGIAMGDTGTDIAADAAGVVLLGEGGLTRIPEAVRVSRQAVKTIQDNIFWFGLVFNLAAVLAAFAGYLSAVAAAIVHQISSLLVLLNSLRLARPTLVLPGRFRPHLPEMFRHLPRLRKDWTGQLRAGAVMLKEQRALWLRRGLMAFGFLYAASGLTLIPADQVGVVQRFGKALPTILEPGLNIQFPWPVDRVHYVSPQRIETLPMGFRLSHESGEPGNEPAAYEWNIQHRGGRYLREEEETLLLTGDEYLLEVNAVIQYSIQDPVRYLFYCQDLEASFRALAEGSLRAVVISSGLDQVLALDRGEIESAVLQRIREQAGRLDLGIEVQAVHLQDVHPALDVVGAFREVASALEEKLEMINEAQGFANERLPLAQGEAVSRVIRAGSGSIARVKKSAGESERFLARLQGYRVDPRTTGTRLYLESLETALGGKKKYLVDDQGGRRRMILTRDSTIRLDEAGAIVNAVPDRKEVRP